MKEKKHDATGKNSNCVIPVFYPAYRIHSMSPMFRYSHKDAIRSEKGPLSSDVSKWSKLIMMLAGL